MYLDTTLRLVSNRMKLYAVDSKIITTINDWIDSNHLQKDLDVVSKWTKDWQMRLNVQKYKVIHFGKKNLGFKYFLQGSDQEITEVEEIKTEKDLEPLVSSSLSWKDQNALGYLKSEQNDWNAQKYIH